MIVRITTTNRAGREVYVDRASKGAFKGKYVVNPTGSNLLADGIGLDTLDEVAEQIRSGRFIPRCGDAIANTFNLVGGPYKFHT